MEERLPMRPTIHPNVPPAEGRLGALQVELCRPWLCQTICQHTQAYKAESRAMPRTHGRKDPNALT
eukprot:4786483-Lingulodinium_polyedra.AAC.1